MTRKQRRGFLLIGGVLVVGVASILVLFALREGIAFFHTPSDVAENKVKPGETFRLGGLVADGSVRRVSGNPEIEFVVTDTLKSVPVSYRGVLPDLFREGQGVVAIGKLDGGGTFRADSVLAKHDENYMPAEVADSLKARGVKLGDGARHPAGQVAPAVKPGS